jgi:hypothetical protein
MRTLDELSRLSTIRDILAFFAIADAAGVVADRGDTILRLWARDVARIDEARPQPPEAERLERYAEALRAAYEAVAVPARLGARGWYVIGGGAGARASKIPDARPMSLIWR